jgi:hypothetical protein
MTDHLPRRDADPRPRPTPLSSLVASAKRISSKTMKRTTKERWQDEAWAMYDEVGELRFVANALASAGSGATLFAARMVPGADDPEPYVSPNPDDPDADAPDPAGEAAASIVAALGGNVLGRAELLRRMILHLFVPGDSFLLGLPPGVIDDAAPTEGDVPPDLGIVPEGALTLSELSWHTLSTSEVQVRNDRIVVQVGGSSKEIDGDAAILIRVWRPHPNRWWQADSPVRANLPVLRELVGLTKHIGATIDSRLAGAGLLPLPASVEVVGNAHDPETGAEQPASEFVDALIDAMVTPIEDRESAAAVVPLVVTVPDDVVGKIGLVSFATPFDAASKDLRDEAIRRLALGLDAPPEVMLGLGSSNHWSAWQIDEATTKTHISPLLGLICDALTTEYLWPALEEAGVANPRDWVVWFDTSGLTMRPNRTPEAIELYDRGELSGEALRRYSAFDETDARPPDDVDPVVDLVVGIAKGAPNLVAADPSVVLSLVAVFRHLLEGEPLDVAALPAPQNGDGPATATGTGTDLPDRPTEMDEPALAAALATLAGRTRA